MTSTIAAQSTPVGRGAIAIIRLSGPDSEKILKSCFKPLSGKKMTASHLTLGTLEAGEIKDRAMAVLFKAPISYTGEDMAEIHVHGSQEIATKTLQFLLKNGARLAESGEFTRRAFLSGKIGLNEAEAVGDLINARSTAQINAAYSALSGATSEEIRGIYAGLLDVISSFDAAVDYPEEDVEEMLESEALEKIKELKVRLIRLARSYEEGAKIKSGIRVAIIGEPNAGKSSLMNRLLGRDRAIVTAVPGTTRDTLEETFEHKGMLFVLVDTAGLHETSDVVESEGIRRARAELDSADIILRLAESGKSRPDITGKLIIDVSSKSDIAKGDGLNVSSVSGEGIEELKDLMFETASSGQVYGGGVVLTSERSYSLTLRALSSIKDAIDEMERASLVDLSIIYLKEAARFVGDIIGASAGEDTLNAIFSKFCVGK
ncbi:MAG: tRNA uridine-5-carboxymethylaminomethyl(34) synthesis GTPase MnmE [Clostridia bacterium]|nr:tRNA uridine-5-carboxymethylaminomethyl(34) synthesis GTPase MnmE [Clostridia bacterium]